MTTEKLYELMQHGFDQIQRQLDEIKETLKSIDERLRKVETDVAEVKGRCLAIKDWFVFACAIGALMLSIITEVHK